MEDLLVLQAKFIALEIVEPFNTSFQDEVLQKYDGRFLRCH